MPLPGSQMQLTRAADYAVRVLIYLATLRNCSRIQLPALTRATDVPSSFLSKIMQALSRAGMVSSRRGPGGGFAILPAGRGASLRRVIEAIHGPVQINVCLQSGKSCPRSPRCPAHPIWVEAQAAMLDVLSRAFIDDLAAEALISLGKQALPDTTGAKTGTR